MIGLGLHPTAKWLKKWIGSALIERWRYNFQPTHRPSPPADSLGYLYTMHLIIVYILRACVCHVFIKQNVRVSVYTDHVASNSLPPNLEILLICYISRFRSRDHFVYVATNMELLSRRSLINVLYAVRSAISATAGLHRLLLVCDLSCCVQSDYRLLCVSLFCLCIIIFILRYYYYYYYEVCTRSTQTDRLTDRQTNREK